MPTFDAPVADPTQSPSPPAEAAVPVNWSRLYADYEANPVAADAAYKDKRIRISLRAETIKQIDGRAVVGHGGSSRRGASSRPFSRTS